MSIASLLLWLTGGSGLPLTVEAACSKHRRKDTLPIHAELVLLVREWERDLGLDDLLYPRHQGRHRIHHHGGGIGGFAARNVETDPIQGRHLHPDYAAIVLGQVEPGLSLTLVVLPHPLDREGQSIP